MLSEKRIQDPTSVVIFSSPYTTFFSSSALFVSVDSVSSALVHAVVGTDLSVRAERQLLDGIPVISRSSAVWLDGSMRINSSRLKHRSLSVVLIAVLLELKENSTAACPNYFKGYI